MVFLQSAPHPALQSFIAQYIYVSYNSNILPSLKQTFLPYDAPAISFFIGLVFPERTEGQVTGPLASITTYSAFAYLSALTTTPYSMYFKENEESEVILIPFKPAGFSALFHSDMAELTNLLPDFSLLTGASENSRIVEQLAEANDFAARVEALNHFFIEKINRPINSNAQIKEACRRLMITNGLMNIKQLAYHTNMSLRVINFWLPKKVL